MTMALIALIAAAEAMLYSASRSKRGQTRRQQVLMGNSMDSVRALPLVDTYLKRKTAGASKVQTFVASKLAEVCRQVVHTQSFEYLLLHVIGTVDFKCRSKFLNKQRRVTL
jgi:hypothetical protein